MNHYTISSTHPGSHYFDVSLTIPEPDPAGQLLRLPAWIPGSYMIRDFAKNIVSIKALAGKKNIKLQQIDKSSWKAEACDAEIKVHYRVYAWDLSVRGAHLDTTHGFFNGTSVFLEVVGQSEQTCSVEINRPQCDGSKHWQLATTLAPEVEGTEYDFEFGRFKADSYQELIDHPVEMGRFTRFHFSAAGIRHDVVLTGRFECDSDRLKQDLTKICEQHVAMFGAPAPMPRYLFLVMVVGEGYGGLEHRNSTSLLCARTDLPHPAQQKMSEEYRSFLGLCSHEYFHSWNVKRITPALFVNPDLSGEVYSPLLWAFEGITSYYDDLALVRSGCIKRQDYLQLLAQTITRVQRGHGRKLQSVAQSSFNTWTKFYKQDENATNAIVSYYAKGALIALCIDIRMRQLTQGERSLDDVMRELWRRYQQGRQGINEFEIQHIVNELVGRDLTDFMRQLIYQTDELPLQETLKEVSVELTYRASAGQLDKGGKEESVLPAATLGAQVKEVEGGLQVLSVSEKGPAQQAGLSAGDLIIAINDLRAGLVLYQSWLKLSAADSEHTLYAFRRDELMRFDITLSSPARDTAMLSIIDESDPALQSWLGEAAGKA